MNYLIALFVLFLLITPYAVTKNATFIVSLVKGFMFGALYNKDEYQEDEVTEHTIQFCFMFITITMIWEKPLN
jgi:hypothetical protein